MAVLNLDRGSEARRAVRYLACGGLAAAVNWGSRFGWSLVLPFQLAVVAAYATGMLVAFVLFRRFVFAASGSGPRASLSGRVAGGKPAPTLPQPALAQARNFVIVNLLGVAQTWVLAVVLVDKVLPAVGWRFQPEACGHALAIAAPVVTSWFGHRYFTFRPAKAGI